jgi:hypothetical protein
MLLPEPRRGCLSFALLLGKKGKRNRVGPQFAVQLPPNCCRSFEKMQYAHRRWAEQVTEDIALPGTDG